MQSGEIGKESTRNYRIRIAGGDLQVRLLGDSSSSITGTLRAGRATVNLSPANQFSDHAQDEPEAREALRILEKYRVTSSKRETLTVAKEKKDCLRVGILSAPGAGVDWTGTIWIERERGLVWRARMPVADDRGQQVHEEVNWVEIRSGPAAGDETWSVPADAVRIDRWRGSLPF